MFQDEISCMHLCVRLAQKYSTTHGLLLFNITTKGKNVVHTHKRYQAGGKNSDLHFFFC
jgi:hypothetical protein